MSFSRSWLSLRPTAPCSILPSDESSLLGPPSVVDVDPYESRLSRNDRRRSCGGILLRRGEGLGAVMIVSGDGKWSVEAQSGSCSGSGSCWVSKSPLCGMPAAEGMKLTWLPRRTPQQNHLDRPNIASRFHQSQCRVCFWCGGNGKWGKMVDGSTRPFLNVADEQ